MDLGRRERRHRTAWMKRVPGLLVAAGVLMAVPLFLLGYYDEVHKWAARQALNLLEKSDRGRLYEEVYARRNRDRIVAGAWMEDYGAVAGNDRSFRHFYDPSTGQGCAFQPYFYAWTRFEGAIVTYPGLRYPSALQWAKDGAGTNDLRNWKGAIEAYDYSGDSRAEAYFRLGHVVHLIADMAEPDHAANTPHAASGLYYPKDLNRILAEVQAAAEYVPGFKDKKDLLEMTIWLNAAEGEKRVGFERLVEDNSKELYLSPAGGKVIKSLSFDWYFQTMALLSRAAIRDRFPLPVGVRFTPETSEAEQAALDVVHGNYSFFPAINFRDPDESERYLNLARELLTSASRLNWGLLEFFHDAVNPPPYVRLVEVSQGGRPCYSAAWADITDIISGKHPNENPKAAEIFAKDNYHHDYRYEKTLRRELPDPKVNQPLVPGVEAEIRIYFGPDPNGFAAVTERMDKVSVRVGSDWIPGKLTDGGTSWTGRFTPFLEKGEEEKDLPIEIAGWDAHSHAAIPGRLALPRGEALERTAGYALDGEPESPAKTSGEAPYHVRGYEPGEDRNHKVRVRAKEELKAEPIPLPEMSLDLLPIRAYDPKKMDTVPGPEAIRGRTPPQWNEIGMWSLSLELSTRQDLGIQIIEREEWKVYPGRPDLRSYYTKEVREGARQLGYYGLVRGLDPPPSNALTRSSNPYRQGESKLGVFDPEEMEKPSSALRRTNLLGGELLHAFGIHSSDNADAFLYKVVYTGRGRDGRIYRAAYVFDSRQWVPAGEKDNYGSVKLKKK